MGSDWVVRDVCESSRVSLDMLLSDSDNAACALNCCCSVSGHY